MLKEGTELLQGEQAQILLHLWEQREPWRQDGEGAVGATQAFTFILDVLRLEQPRPQHSWVCEPELVANP